MNSNEILSGMESITQHYREELDRFSLEELLRKPSEEAWSIGQVYLHLINWALNGQLRNVEKCRNMDAQEAASVGEINEAGQAVFDQGGLPPTRVHVPASQQYTPPQPESKEQIAEGLTEVLRRMKETAPTLAFIPAGNKVEHPRLGWLNANQWFALVEMHFRHHLLQIDRLKAAVLQ